MTMLYDTLSEATLRKFNIEEEIQKSTIPCISIIAKIF
jgi:hypothetical protein